MMLFVFITLFVITSGFTLADESCSRNLRSVCEPESEPFMPKTAKELDTLCGIIISALECAIPYEERCHTVERFFPYAYGFLAAFHEICDHNTLLHAAVAENIECFMENVKSQTGHCYMEEPLEETLQSQAEELSKEGFQDFTSENEFQDPHTCLLSLNRIACQAMVTKEICGTLAKDTFVEVARKLPIFEGCINHSGQMLPAFIRLIEVENEVEEALERRKK